MIRNFNIIGIGILGIGLSATCPGQATNAAPTSSSPSDASTTHSSSSQAIQNGPKAAPPPASPLTPATIGTPTHKTVQPVNSTFCAKGVPDEVVAYCPALVSLMNEVNDERANVLLDQVKDAVEASASGKNTLVQLDPTDRRSMKYLVAVVRNRQVSAIAQSDVTNAFQSAGAVRPDQQFGPSSSASGTTSLVTKAGSAELISLGVDTGTLTQSVNGSTATIGVNADEIYRLLSANSPDCLMNCGKNGAAEVGGFEGYVLNRLNLSGSFSLAQSSSTTTSTSGQASGTTATPVAMVAIPAGAGRLTSITAKYQIHNKYDPRSSDFRNAWAQQITTLGPAAILVSNDTESIRTALETDATFKAAENQSGYQDKLVVAAANDPSGGELVSAFEALWGEDDLDTALSGPSVVTAAAALMKDQELFRQAWAEAIDQVAGNMLSFQYAFNKPLNQPQTHDITFIYGYSWAQHGSITANGSVSIYNGALPAGASYGRIHYGQASAEYDRNLSNPNSKLQSQLTLAGYWQYQPQPSVLNIPAGTVAPGTMIPLPNGTQEFVGTAGNLWVTQAALTIKGAGGINIPVGVSWSNKTDLLQGSKVGAQVGISYNFPSIAGLF